MALNKQKKGNMYGFITDSWNPIRGICLHRCKYCYARRVQSQWGVVSLNEKCLNDKLGKQRSIFVGSSTDMWGRWVSPANIRQVLTYCQKFNSNSYLFQTKNPERFYKFRKIGLPTIAIYGTTIETTNEKLSLEISKAPSVWYRYADLADLNMPKKMVSLEPIMDFSVSTMIRWLFYIRPSFVSIGADSKNHHLPEPPAEKIKELIAELQKFTEVKIKPNLTRLMG